MLENLGFLSAAIVPVIAFVLVVLLVMPFRKFARIVGIVDAPGGRKQHDKAIPPIGGLVIFSVFLVLGVVSGVVDLQKYWPLYLSLVVLLVSGALDDQFPIHARLKFVIHIGVAALIAFMGNVQAAYLGDLFGFGVVWTGFMSYPFTIIAIVLLINAMNLMDGMDGLAGGVSVVMFAWFGVACVVAGFYSGAQVLVLLIACLCGFLVFNMRNPWRRKASLFLGDAGSMSLGLTIAWFSVLLARGPESPIEPIAVAWIIGFPIFDTCAQFFRRVCEGRDPFSPDRGHFHHHFIDAGVPVRWASVIIIAIVAVMGAIGYGGIALGLPPFILTIGWILLLLAHIAMSKNPQRYVCIIRAIVQKCQCGSEAKSSLGEHD
ncbi:MAG: MraY family glycosyltransferase [Alphaproteobacteria bacterium]